MFRWVRVAVGTALIVAIFLAWAEGRQPAVDFAEGVGRVTGDVISAVVEFMRSLGENKPDVDTLGQLRDHLNA